MLLCNDVDVYSIVIYDAVIAFWRDTLDAVMHLAGTLLPVIYQYFIEGSGYACWLRSGTRPYDWYRVLTLVYRGMRLADVHTDWLAYRGWHTGRTAGQAATWRPRTLRWLAYDCRPLLFIFMPFRGCIFVLVLQVILDGDIMIELLCWLPLARTVFDCIYSIHWRIWHSSFDVFVVVYHDLSIPSVPLFGVVRTYRCCYALHLDEHCICSSLSFGTFIQLRNWYLIISRCSHCSTVPCMRHCYSCYTMTHYFVTFVGYLQTMFIVLIVFLWPYSLLVVRHLYYWLMELHLCWFWYPFLLFGIHFGIVCRCSYLTLFHITNSCYWLRLLTLLS